MIVGTLRGLRVTLRNFLRRSVTVRYPEQRNPLPERFRGRLFFDPNICTGCLMCEEACPNGALKMVPWGQITNSAKPQGRDFNLYPQVDVAMCTYCGWCEDVCPTSAIRHTDQFELSRYDRDHFEYTPEMLSESERRLGVPRSHTNGAGGEPEAEGEAEPALGEKPETPVAGGGSKP